MSMERAIASGKEHRNPYCGAKAADCTCRNHGSCKYCRMNRTYAAAKRLESAKLKLLDDFYAR